MLNGKTFSSMQKFFNALYFDPEYNGIENPFKRPFGGEEGRPAVAEFEIPGSLFAADRTSREIFPLLSNISFSGYALPGCRVNFPRWFVQAPERMRKPGKARLRARAEVPSATSALCAT